MGRHTFLKHQFINYPLYYMTYEEIIELGWLDRDDKKGLDKTKSFIINEEEGRWLLSIYLPVDESGFHDMVMVKWVGKKIKKNIWENGDTHFYGSLKTAADLKNVMRYLDIIEY